MFKGSGNQADIFPRIKVFMQVALRYLSVPVALIGLTIMLRSNRMGLLEVNKYVHTVGGTIDSNTYQTLLISAINTYRLLGALLVGIGLAATMFRARADRS